MKKKLNLIFIPQEYNTANHKELWSEISRQSEDITIIVNIGADLVVSLIKGRYFRIREAMGRYKLLNYNLNLIRPMYLIRPEISNEWINSLNARLLILKLKKIVKNIDEYQINLLYYDAVLIDLFNKLNLDVKYYYYILDEVRNDAHDNNINVKRTKYDKLACDISNHIFLMSSKLTENRKQYIKKIEVVGNGAVLREHLPNPDKYEKSVGLIGNIRDWIDSSLLEDLIKSRQDLHFGFVGNIESNMQSYIDIILKKYKNVTYYGIASKEEVYNWYRKFDVVIVPYKQNEFMKATRPIKIVESVFAQTPVVTIPVSGYKQCEFIRFANTSEEFSKEINYLIKNKIDIEAPAYIEFIRLNSWSNKAKQILEAFKSS